LVRTQLEASDPTSFQLASGQVQFVEFFAFWSPLSQSMAPVVFRLEDRYKDRIYFVYLDIDDPANDLFKHLIDNRLPPIYYLVDGEGNVLGEWSGYVMEETFTAVFETVLQ
jgi:thiol-disulfide isomerase/thioredoxin